MTPDFHYSASFVESAKQINASNPLAWAGLVAAIEYLRRFKRSAVAPDVRWGVALSEFGADAGEIRWPDPESQTQHSETALRGLFVAHPSDEWYVFTLLGNKAKGLRRGNAWYPHAVAQSDRTTREAIETLGLIPFPEVKT